MKTDETQNGISILLANRIYLYRLLQNIFGTAPTLEALRILSSDHTFDVLDLLSVEAGAADQIRELAKQLADCEQDTLDKCGSEYTRLLLGPTKLPAPPWESVYVSKERLIFQESTLKVRECYLKYSLLPAHYGSEPDDHLALELDFMASLSQLAEAAYNEGDKERLLAILSDQKAFLDEHLLVWVPQFVADLEAATANELYNGSARLLIHFLKTDYDVINEIIGVLQ